MATKIRLKRFGARHDPHFRIVVADSRRQRDGRAIEELGHYTTGSQNKLEVNAERVHYWLGVGAIPTETVQALLVKAGVLEGPQYEGVAEEIDEAAAAADEAEEAEGAEEAEEAEEETE